MIYVSRVVNLLVSTTVGRVVIYARGGFIRFAAGIGEMKIGLIEACLN